MKPQHNLHQIKNIALSVLVMSATIIAQGARSIASPSATFGSLRTTSTLAQTTSPSNPNAPTQTRPANPGDTTVPGNTTTPGNPPAPNTTSPSDPSNPTTPSQTTPPSPTAPSTTTPGSSPNADYAGNWAEPFIRALIERNIIVGYPDGTYRPDQPITRAEFAALLNKAFELPAVRASRTFRDVPANYWAASAIDRAYRAGFLAGYPNGTFAPSRNIIRIESLVALTNGSQLRPDNTADRVNELFTDAGQVPSYGRDALLAATQRCVAVSFAYPTTRTYDPNRIATRADVAASLHQILVAAGRIPALPGNSPAQQYIVNCGTSSTAKITEQDILNRTNIGTAPGIVAATGRKPANAPAGGITTPTAFGADLGEVFIGAGFQNSIPAPFAVDGNSRTVYGAGLGLGNARDFIGLEASYTAAGDSFADRGGFNFKVHKQFGDNFAIAGGWENAIRNGYTAANDPGQTFYGVASAILPVGETSNFTASVGTGNGRFRTFSDLSANNSNLNIFGSLGFRFNENLALAADYNGRTYSVGLPITFKLGDNVGLQVTPSWLDFAGDSTAVGRFGLGGGVGIRF